jgi:hypothetical protein
MRILKLEKIFQSLAEDVFDRVPENPDRTAGLRKLLEAKWTLCHAVSHGGGIPVMTKEESEK